MVGSHGKKPFKGKTFYLDLKFYRNQVELIKNMKKLGAKVESFFSKDVTHLVTDRNNFKTKYEINLPATPRSSRSIQSPVNFDYSCDVQANLGLLNDGRNQILSRGQALLQKAKPKNQGSTDIFGLCSQWKIKIVPLQKVLSHISVCKELLKKNTENKVPKEKVASKLKYFKQRLQSPFMKFEDIHRYFKPHYKEFKEWKDCLTPAFHKVICRMLKKYSKKPNFDTKFNWFYGKEGPLTNSNVLNVEASPLQPSVTFVGSTRQLLHKENMKNKNKKHVGKTKKVSKRFCEICSCSYMDLNKHLVCEKHKKFMNDRTNFKIIDDVAFSLPSVNDFLQKTLIQAPSLSLSSAVGNENNYDEAPVLLPYDGYDAMTGKDGFVWCFPVNQDNDSKCYIDYFGIPEPGIFCTDEVISASCTSEELKEVFPYLECEIPPLLSPKRDVETTTNNAGNGAPTLPLCTSLDDYKGNDCVRNVSKNLTFEEKLSEKEPVSLNAIGISTNKDVIVNNLDITLPEVAKTVPNDYSEMPCLEAMCDVGKCAMCPSLGDKIPRSDDNETRYGTISPNSLHSISDTDLNEKLYINGCVIKRYPFRNFGYGLENKYLKSKSNKLPVESVRVKEAKSSVDFGIGSASDSEQENECLKKNITDLCHTLQIEENRLTVEEGQTSEQSALDLSVKVPIDNS